MGKWDRRFVLCLAVVLLVATAFASHAEVTADTAHQITLLVMGITEGPDPIPQVYWDSVRFLHPEDFGFVLNPTGGADMDGRPDEACHPDTRWAHVVWASNLGTHHDIVYSAWTGTEWSDPDPLTESPANELDPRISISSGGTVYVVWWDADVEQVWMSTRETGISAWADPEPVTGVVDSGRRPSILEWEGEVLTAYERDSSKSLGQEIVLATRVGAGVYTTEVISTSPSDEPLNVILHNEQGVLWVDWRHSNSEYAYSVYSGDGWGPRVTLSWTSNSWAKVEEVRQVIRNAVLGQ